jgi:hypothetical protein
MGSDVHDGKRHQERREGFAPVGEFSQGPGRMGSGDFVVANLTSSRFLKGTRVGPYCLLEFLGRGHYGEVWLAERDSEIASSRLAIKLPLDAVVDLEAIRTEAQVWIRAGNHPNVLPLFEANRYGDQVVIVSEYAADGSLERWLQTNGGKAPSFELAVDMTLGILSGLEHLHVRGIVHRDLKPANILMQGECPRIADFGLARLLDRRASASRVAGTPAYMAPETFDGERSVQTDLWSVGVILHQMLGGALPFPENDLMCLLKAIADKPPQPLPASTPQPIQQVVQTALAKAPGSRYRSAADMRAALRDTLRQLESKTLGSKTLPVSFTSRGGRTIAITGSSWWASADPRRAAHRVRALVTPYCGAQTTWYCGTVGVVDECAAEFLLAAGQRVIAVGYGAGDISREMRAILSRHDAPFVDAQSEPVPPVPEAPSKRDIFFATKADLIIILWDGASSGTGQLLAWLRRERKDHILGFL